ncbi:hypothetical protein DCAR_0104778 [Daucus carota subsp. sativus]|uniref:Exocyst subunit Exo70 family protein n=1 Tax=Daucus carota subsp. sativus TaxID=79200 RepID=A0A162B9S9_DAUCS|nr:PREDICTED: exocyst complex component EXO70A1-like [Daucus carota subsp. sativus]WOG85587.1 hypothetical protein DCAR_0104778 [Daucus carota subsp. sativus]
MSKSLVDSTTDDLQKNKKMFLDILDRSTYALEYDRLSSTLHSSSVTSSYGYEFQGRNRNGEGELSSPQMNHLHSIIKRLSITGCHEACIEAYRNSRKSVVDARCRRFCTVKRTTDDLQRFECEEFATEIRIWIDTANICYNNIFPEERNYYEQIFYGVGSVTDDNCFLAIIKPVAIQLNNFADAASYISSFQKLFAVLDLYKALFSILPKIQGTFNSASCRIISEAALKTIDSLANQVRKLFCSFEDTVFNEQSKTLPAEGTIHSMTTYAMKFVTSISVYKEVLTNVIVSRPTKSLGTQAYDQFLEASRGTPLELHVIWIIISLKINLEGKSSLYGDSSLRQVFIMNNVNRIFKTITGSPELLKMIQEEYLSELSKEVVQAAEDYSTSVSNKFLYCLRDDGLNFKYSFSNWIVKNSVKKRIKAFNTTFEEASRIQSRMPVLDVDIPFHLHELILSKLLPAYKLFLQKYGSLLQSERNKDRYIKYTLEDLEHTVKTYFQHAPEC